MGTCCQVPMLAKHLTEDYMWLHLQAMKLSAISPHGRSW